MSPKILLVDDEPIILKFLSTTLTTASFEVTTANHAKEALDVVEKQLFDLIIMDVMMPEIDGYQACQRFRKNPRTAKIPIILLTSLSSLENKIKGFEAGADDYLPKPCEPAELIARVNVLLRRASQETKNKPIETKGKVVSIHSLRGGVGISTLAANLAVGLAQLWGIQTALIDLVLIAGQAALMLNLPLRNTWTDVATTPDEEIDLEMIGALLRMHRSGVNVLPAPRRIEDSELIDAPKVTRVIDLTRQIYDYVVLDLPHDFSATTIAGLDTSDTLLAILAPELASIRAMSMALSVYDHLGYPSEKIRLILNCTFGRFGLSREDIESALGRKIDLVIPYAQESIVRTINLGSPLIFEEPTSTLGALFEDLAFVVSKETHKKNRPLEPTASWKRLVKRIQQKKARQ